MIQRTTKTLFGLSLCLSLCAPQAQAGFVNVIVNGDFEQGNTGFYSQYTYGQAGGALGAAGSYDVLTNPKYDRQYDINPPNFGDHTTGHGLMFAGNGAEVPNVIVWQETVPVAVNADYSYSMWITSWFAGSPATFDILFNGVSIGTPAAPPVVGLWQEFSTPWNSGTATSVTITIYDTNLVDVGSDFAMDDLSLDGPAPNSVPEPASVVLLLTGFPFLVLAIRAGRHHRRRPTASLRPPIASSNPSRMGPSDGKAHPC